MVDKEWQLWLNFILVILWTPPTLKLSYTGACFLMTFHPCLVLSSCLQSFLFFSQPLPPHFLLIFGFWQFDEREREGGGVGWMNEWELAVYFIMLLLGGSFLRSFYYFCKILYPYLFHCLFLGLLFHHYINCEILVVSLSSLVYRPVSFCMFFFINSFSSLLWTLLMKEFFIFDSIVFILDFWSDSLFYHYYFLF